ncbi:MAG TPA: S53 family peptidase [Vicinamibacterales bacterium]|nr:S53 family peptidase [Vicinamibacterales bacterium]
MTRRWSRLDPAPRRPHVSRRSLRPEERDDRIRVTVVLSPRTSARARDNAVHALARQWPQARKYLSFDELCYQHGATKEAAERVADHFSGRGMKVHEVTPHLRTVVLSGEFAEVARAFGVRPVVCGHREHHFRSFEGRIRIPWTLTRDISSVLGLDQGPLLRHAAAPTGRRASHGVDPADVGRIYDFPPFVRGLGQTIGIISLGGGFHRRDARRGASGRGRGSVDVVEIAGAANSPARRPLISAYLREIGMGPDDGATLKVLPATARFNKVVWTLETSMDVQVAAALAPDARILVYFAPNTEAGKFAALMRAIMTPDGPSVISCSWGNVERQFTAGWVQLLEEIFQTAALAGVTMCYSSGDSAAGPHYPASSPHVLSCGGTTLDVNARRVPERCWSETIAGQSLASGGGVSHRFRRDPVWQAPARVRAKTGRHGRGLPDVAARANLSPGYTVRIGTLEAGLGGGTSASAPLWAALFARINQALRTRCGYITPLLYSQRCRHAFRDILEGSNGVYSARPGWDACTGWGTPRGTRLLNALRPRRR